jgi:hypothetical protein
MPKKVGEVPCLVTGRYRATPETFYHREQGMMVWFRQRSDLR